MEVPEGLFKDVKYYLIGNLDEKIQKLLNDGGAKRDYYLSEMITHAIADDPHEDDCTEAKELFELPVVTSRWVILSVRCGCLLPTNAFFPDDNQLFSDVVACPSQLSEEDSKGLWGMITFNGGSCQMELNKRVTHLICVKPSGPKYDCAMRHRDNVVIVTPDWVTDSVREKGRQKESVYHPHLLRISDGNATSSSPEIDNRASTPNRSRSPGSSKPPLVQFTPLNTANTSRDSHSTKVALAKLVNNRMQATGRVHETPEISPGPFPPMIPGIQPPGTPPTPVGPRSPRPQSPRTLRNITNSGEPKSPGKTSKINQLVNSMSRAPGLPPAHNSPQHAMMGLGRSPNFGHPQQDCAVYFGHDPIETVPSDLCLLGCVFYITDFQKFLQEDQINTWRIVIQQHGGQVDDSYSNRITHLLCENQKSDVFKLALKDQKRLVTPHWLNDCLLKKKMAPPYAALHFPSVYGVEKPGGNQIVCCTGFVNEERNQVKNMIGAIGAKYTGYMTYANSILVCKKPEGHKYLKALEWCMPVVNATWLTDMVLGHTEALKKPVHPRYQQYGMPDPFRVDLWKVGHLMDGWKSPLRIHRDAWKRFDPAQLLNKSVPEKRKGENLSHQQVKRQRVEQHLINGVTPPVVLITGIPKNLVETLERKVEAMGGQVVDSASGCTHLVANTVGRTVKFLTAFSRVKYLVAPEWIEQSAAQGKFLPEVLFPIIDQRTEKEFEFNLQESLRRARAQKLFQEFMFYITPGVIPSKAVLHGVIESAGGKVVSKRPSIRAIVSRRDVKGNPTFIVITCENDLFLSESLTKRNIAVHNAEFILTGVLRQEVDYETYRL